MNYLQRLHTTEALANWTSLTALTHSIALTHVHTHTHTSISENIQYICMCSSNTLQEKSNGEQPVQISSTYRCESKRDRINQSGHLRWGSLEGSKDREGTNEAHEGTRKVPMQHLDLRWWNCWESQSSVRAGLTYQSFLYSKCTEEREGTHTDCTNWYRDTSEQQSFGRETDRLCQQSAEMMSQSEADRAKRSQSVRRRLRICSESCTNILFLQYTVFAFVFSDDLLKLPLFAVYSRTYCTVMQCTQLDLLF